MEIGATNGTERLGELGTMGSEEVESARAGEGESDVELFGEVEEWEWNAVEVDKEWGR